MALNKVKRCHNVLTRLGFYFTDIADVYQPASSRGVRVPTSKSVQHLSLSADNLQLAVMTEENLRVFAIPDLQSQVSLPISVDSLSRELLLNASLFQDPWFLSNGIPKSH
jgi:hypothetical protein